MHTDKHRFSKGSMFERVRFGLKFISVCICVCLWLNFLTSCGSKPADLRAFVPDDSLIYLESNDLGAVMKTITDRPAFREAAKTIPDFSVLNGVKLAVAVTGFETKEEKVTDEDSVLSFQPRFVAILETNAWNYQALAFTEHKLGEFINNVYGGEVLLETSSKHDGKYFVWTANDGRKAYALVHGSLVFFGNDDTAIERSLAVKRGEAESIAKNPKITDGERLAFGYVSPDGVAQLSNLIGVYAGIRAGEENEVKTFIASVLPGLLRNSVKEISWTASQTSVEFGDSYSITLNADVAKAFEESMRPVDELDPELLYFIPHGLESTSQYTFKDPRLAWRSSVLAASTQTTAINGDLIVVFSASLFEPYAIEDPELFLSAVAGSTQTVTFGSEGQESAVIAKVSNLEAIKRSIASEIDLKKPPEKFRNADLWKSADEEFALALVNGKVIVGDQNVVRKCVEAGDSNENAAATMFHNEFADSGAQMSTFARERGVTAKLASVISEPKADVSQQDPPYFVETKFNSVGIVRKVRSDFGLIGWMITQFAADE